MYLQYKACPSVNPLVTQRYIRNRQRKHKKKLRHIKSTVDNKPPAHWQNRPTRNLKKEQMMEERYSTIERENRILLSKMSYIMQHNTLDNFNRLKPKSLNREFRKRELIRITNENQAILRRIQKSEPTYNHLKWEEDRKVHEGYLRNIVLYKFGQGPGGAAGPGTPGGARLSPGARPRSAAASAGMRIMQVDRPRTSGSRRARAAAGGNIWSDRAATGPLEADGRPSQM